MSEVLSQHEFANGRRIAMELLDADDQRREGAVAGDVLALVFAQPDKRTRMLMRPDEALVVIKVLAEGVCNATEGYTVKE